MAQGGGPVATDDKSGIDLERMAASVFGLDEAKDLHRERAAELFGVAPEDVTEEQRRAAKTLSFRDNYGLRGPVFVGMDLASGPDRSVSLGDVLGEPDHE